MDRPILLLDVMGTLVHDPFFTEVPAFLGIPMEQLYRQLAPGKWVEFEYGRLDEDSFLRQFFADGRDYDAAGMRALVHDSYRLLPGIEALLDELRAAGVEMHALSNYPCWYQAIEAQVGLSRWLAWSFVSCDTGARKPDPEAYLGAARTLEVPPSACLFVDDRGSNCEAARAVGMDAIRFTDAEALREGLWERGVLRTRP